MVAYVVATMKIHDPETYRKYTERTPDIVKRYGGKFLTRGEPVTTVEGETFTERMVLLEFPSAEKVQAWFNDPDYVAACVFRHAASTARLLLQEGGANTHDPDPKV